jgi:DNA-binding transcriptional ArsR family regulator
MGSSGTTLQLNRTFFALSDPTRRRILHLLGTGPATVSALAERFDQSLPGISKHVQTLSHAGLVSVRRSRTDRRTRVCRVRAQGLADVERWIHEHRAAWEDRFVALERFLDTEVREGAE